ncbi:retrovirus-related pol polyprotein from transposon TNT 1-94 [Tanacetum coccineum]
MYDSWKSRVELYIENRENGRMILNSVLNGPLVWPTIDEENGTIRTKKYEELLVEKLQADCVKLQTSFFKVFHWMFSSTVKHNDSTGDDSIACLNKAMAFLTAVASLRFLSTNNQLRTSSNPRNQATIQDGRVTMQQVQGRQRQSYAGTGYKGEGHMSRQCTQPKRPRNAAWFKEKAMLAEAQESSQILDEEQLAFLADPGIPDCQAAQTTIPNTAAFQTEDLDAYDSYCDDVSNVKAVLMANLSNYGYDVISKLTMQLNQEVFQKDTSSDNQNALEIPKYFENNDLKAQLRAKDTTICKLKEHIKSIREYTKEENVKQEIDEIETINIELEHNIHQGIVKQAKAKQPLDNALDFACEHAKQIQELLVYVRDTCPTANKPSQKLVAVTPMNKVKKVRFSKPLTSSSNIHKQVESSKIPDSNTPVLPSTGLKSSTSASRSQPTDNKKNYRISQTPSSNMKNKVEVQHRRVNLNSNKKNRVKDPICDANIKHTMLNTNSELICSDKKSQQHNIWKPTGKVFNEIGYKFKPTRRLFTIVGNSCPLTRITPTKVVQLKEPTSNSVKTPKPEIIVYSRRPKQKKTVGSSKKAKIIESKIANNSEPNHSWGSNATDVPSSSSLINDSKFLRTVRFRNDQIAKIMGYGDYQLGNVTISRVYYVQGLGHNLFSVRQFYNVDLEVAFQKNTCFIRNLEGIDLLSGSRDTDLYTISLDDMLKTFAIYLLSKALKTKSWLWHYRLSHLNFGTLNKLAKDSFARGIPKLKFKKDHLCSACALGKSKKSSHQPKAKDTNQEKLHLLHMDLCGPMRVESINGKKYILVIVDDYSRFTWVKFLRSKDVAPDAIIKCIKNIQVRLNATVRNVRTDNGSEFFNQTLREFYKNVRITHQTFVARTPQQNGVVER